MPITALPTPPSRNDPTNFSTRADAFLGALPAFATEANAVETNVNTRETNAINAANNAASSASAAAASANAAATTAGVTAWSAATNYTLGQVVYDTTDFLTYRRRVAGTTATRPGLDPANWTLITPSFAIPVVSLGSNTVDCSLGNYFTRTIAADSTFTFSNPPTGAFTFTLELTHTSGNVTWPGTVRWPRNIQPLLTTGRTHVFTFTTINGGTIWRAAALVDYQTA